MTPPADKQELGGGLPFHRWAWAAGFAMMRGQPCHGGIGRIMTVLEVRKDPVSPPPKGYDFFFPGIYFFGLGGLGHSFCFCGATLTAIH